MAEPATPSPAPTPRAAWSVTNTKEAAAFAACGFVITTQVTELVEKRGKVQVRLMVDEVSARDPGMRRGEIYQAYRSGRLEQEMPRHPYLLALRAAHNDEQLQRWRHQGGVVSLRSDATGWELVRNGEHQTRLEAVPAHLRVATTDRALAAALVTIGAVPLTVDTAGDRPAYVFHPLTLDGAPLAPLLRRSAAHARDLALELEQPDHPLCAAYAGAWAKVQLARHLAQSPRAVILRAEGSQRRAYISEQATGRVMDKVTQFFGVVD